MRRFKNFIMDVINNSKVVKYVSIGVGIILLPVLIIVGVKRKHKKAA